MQVDLMHVDQLATGDPQGELDADLLVDVPRDVDVREAHVDRIVAAIAAGHREPAAVKGFGCVGAEEALESLDDERARVDA